MPYLEFSCVGIEIINGVANIDSITNPIHGDVLICTFDGTIADHALELVRAQRRIDNGIRGLVWVHVRIVSFQSFEISDHGVVEIRFVRADLNHMELTRSDRHENE